MKSGSVVAALAVVAVVSLFLHQGQAAITCGQVDASLAQCVTYLTGSAASPSAACCTGVKAVKGMVKTTQDKRAACRCVKAAANQYSNLKDAAAKSLPAKCGVTLNIPISRTVNCDKVV